MTELARLRAALAEIRMLAADLVSDRTSEIAAIADAALEPPEPTPDTRPALSTRQSEVLEYICDHIAAYGYPPTVRVIATACGVNISVIQRALKALESNGYVRHEPRASRTFVPVEAS